jgi:hypothetical protein
MYVCSIVAARNEIEDEDEEGGLKDFMDWWVPKLDQAYISGGGFASFIRPTGLLAWGMKLTDDEEYSAEDREKLSDAAHDWVIGFSGNSDLLSSYSAAWAKCYWLSKDYLGAAIQLDHLLDRGVGLSREIDAAIRLRIYLNAAECYRKGGETETAIHRMEECAKEFPRAGGVWLKLAELYLWSPLTVDPQQVQECLRKEAEIDPAFASDPRTSIAIALGELAGTSVRAVLRKAAESNPAELQIASALVARHWPAFQSLDEETRKEWIGAALLLWGSSPVHFARRKIAGQFADIAEGQLGQLFHRYRQERGPAVLQGIPYSSNKDKFVKYLEGSHLGLGEMISEIEATRRPPDLKSWLRRHAPKLQNWDVSRAWRLNELRRACNHPGEISEQEALEIYDLSVWLISQLAAN